ncbi:MAG: TonB-dependent receptor plug domain-containing protein [Deltaproteobacteria bacterium]|nr:TonB-dependent receptor plug domain-containing protein [Deltaproteobacteria bacterium]
MRFIVSKTLLVSLCIFLIIPVNNSFAVSKKEWQDLNLFYGKDDLVVTSTRHPKHISEIPENMEVVTSEEIEKMNAHTVAEVLSRVTGVFVKSINQDFGSNASLTIQGSGAQMHVMVMIDGIRFNNISEGFPSNLNLPVGIVERIEIIKGPASSAWGSSLGGVINIITKNPDKEKGFSGKIQTSYGKENSQDHRLELSGTKGKFGYYLFGNIQDSDGLVDTRYYKNQNYFSKFKISPFKSTQITISSGMSNPEMDDGHAIGDNGDPYKLPTHWLALNLISEIEDLTLQMDLSKIRQKLVYYTVNSTTGIRTRNSEYDNEMYMIKGLASYEYNNNHTLVFGYDRTIPASFEYSTSGQNDIHEEIDKSAYFINNTFNFGNFTVVPGFRYDVYDYENIKTRDFLSPSIGGVYRISDDTIIRGTIAKGFNEVPLEWLTNSSWGNPNVENEEVVSYQTGFETRSIPYIWLKTSAFYHILENKIDEDTSHNVENIGDVKRYGCEFEVKTLKLMNFSFSIGGAFARSKYDHNQYYLSNYSALDPVNKYMLNLGFVYEDKEPYKNSDFLRIELLSKFVYWDLDNSSVIEKDDTIWDLNISKRFNIEGYGAEFFAVAHNIFNGNQYVSSEQNQNPSSWLECGIKLFF